MPKCTAVIVPRYSTSDFIALLYGQFSQHEASTRRSWLVEELGGSAPTVTFDIADFVARARLSEEGAWRASLVLGPGEPQLNEFLIRAKELGDLFFGRATVSFCPGTFLDKIDPAQPACGQLYRQGADLA